MRSLLGTLFNTTPVPYVNRGSQVSRIYSEPKGALAEMRAYGGNGALYGIVNRLMTSTAAVGWDLWKKAPSGKPEDRTLVTRHAALNLLNKPNGFFTQRELFETVQQHTDLTGEGWLVVARAPRMKSLPLELWPVRPDRIRPVVSPTDFALGYIYTSPDGEQVPLALGDVIRMRMPDPENPYRGLGPVQALMRTLDSTRWSEEWNRNFFVNNAEPGGIIEVEERLGDDEFNEFQARWAETHQGIGNAHRVAILENKMKWVDRKYTMREMQFAEVAAVAEAKTQVAFGFPDFMLGKVKDVNRASAEASDAMFGKWLVTPRLDRWKDMLNTYYLPMFGTTTEGLELDYQNPVPPDAEAENAERNSKATAAKTYIDAGFTGESVVEALNLPDSLKWEKPEPQQPPAQPVPAGQQPQPGKPAALLVYNQAPTDDEDLQQVQEEWEKALAVVLAMWSGITAAQRADLIQQVTAAVAAGDLAALATMQAPTEQATAVLATALAGMAGVAAAQMAAEALAQGVTLPIPPGLAAAVAPIAAAFAGLLAAGYATSAGKEAVRLAVPGASPDSVAAGVDAHLAGLSDAYLREQLGGALTRAQNVGRLETVRPAAGVPQAIYYGAETLDRNTCKPCRDIDGYEFPSWYDAWLAYAGGPYALCLGGLRCRGTVKARWNEAAG